MLITTEFGGGVDEYFGRSPALSLALPDSSSFPELFTALAPHCSIPIDNLYKNGEICPGYLLLVNDADYELLGKDYKLQDRDVVAIISLVHGG
ncbi:hypothetical protein RCL1_002068 [Eukaryota sp. TZLM3-RCL]